MLKKKSFFPLEKFCFHFYFLDGPPPLLPTSMASMDYLEYLKKMAPLLKQSMTPSPNPMVSSTQAAVPSPPTGPGSNPGAATSELISRLYFGNLAKNLNNKNPSSNTNNSNNTYDSPLQKPSSSHLPSVPIAGESNFYCKISPLDGISFLPCT